MASDYTTNFNLDKYVGTDKPNLRDQYNSAMDKIDAQLKLSSDNAALAVQTANNAVASVSGFDSRISSVEGDVSSIELEIPSSAFDSTHTVKAAIDAVSNALTSEVSARQSADNTLSTAIATKEPSIAGRNFVFIGDSYAVLQTNWVDVCVTLLGLSSNQWTKIAANSRGFRGDPNVSGDMSWKKLLQDNISNVPNPSAVTDVIIIGGTNDTYSLNNSAYNTIYTAIGDFFNYALPIFPNATFHVGYVGYTTNLTWLRSRTSIIRLYNESASRFSRVRSIPDSYKMLHYVPWLTDQVHPDSNGTKEIASGIANYIKTGKINFYTANSALAASTAPKVTLDGDFASGAWDNADCGKIEPIYDGEVCGIQFIRPIQQVNFSTPKSFSFNDSPHKFANIPDFAKYFVGSDICTRVFTDIGAYVSGSGFTHIPAAMYIYGGDIYFSWPMKAAGTTTDLTINNVSAIKFVAPTILMPAINN